MAMHTPDFSEHSTVSHGEADGKKPSSGGAEPRVVLRRHPAPVDAERHRRAQTHTATAQHHRVTSWMRPLNYPVVNNIFII